MANPFMDDPFNEDGAAGGGIAVRASASPSLPSPSGASNNSNNSNYGGGHEVGGGDGGASGGMADVRFDGASSPAFAASHAPAAYDSFPAPAPYTPSPYVPSAYVPPGGAAPYSAEPPVAYDPRGSAGVPSYSSFSSMAPIAAQVAASAAAAAHPPAAASPQESEPVSTHLEGPRPSHPAVPDSHAWGDASPHAAAPEPVHAYAAPAPAASAPAPYVPEHKGESPGASSAAAAYAAYAAGAPVARLPPAEEKSRYIIMITDPEKKGEGISSFVAYKITTMKEVDGRTTQSIVYRRFSEFVWLHDRLAAHHKGCIIPPMPEKAITGRGTQEFIQERRRGLEVFLNRVAVHRELRHTEDVELFITADDATFAAAKSKKEKDDTKAAAAEAAAAAESTSSQKKGFMAMFQQTVQSISNSVGSGKERAKSEGDVLCDKIQQYADALELQLAAVHMHADSLIKKEKTLAKTWFDFGHACTLLGKYEGEQHQQELGTVFAHLGNCADRLSIMLGKRAEMENINFREPIRDYMRMVNSVKNMLKSRAGVLLWYQTTLTALESRQAKLAEMQGKPGKDKAQAACDAALQENETALKELNRVTELALAETQRFRAEKHKDLQQVIIEFVKLQIEDGKNVGRAWQGILEEIVPKPGSSPSAGVAGASP